MYASSRLWIVIKLNLTDAIVTQTIGQPMPSMPIPVRVFHITAIDNLAAIFEQGALLCKQRSEDEGRVYHNIAHAGAQGARANKAVVDPPGGHIHDYVPFYFAPRSPMLLAIHHGKVEGCHYRQEDIVHIELLARTVHDNGGEFVFFDRNATKAYSQCYTDPTMLKDVVDWELLTEAPQLDGFCKFFQDQHDVDRYIDRMEKRQAEFLVKDEVPVAWTKRIGVASEAKAEQVRALVAAHGLHLPVEVMTDWYFFGQ